MDLQKNWRESIKSNLAGNDELIEAANNTFDNYPFFKLISNWVNAYGDMINILGNGAIHSNYFTSYIDEFLEKKSDTYFLYFRNNMGLQLKLAVPTQTSEIYGDKIMELIQRNYQLQSGRTSFEPQRHFEMYITRDEGFEEFNAVYLVGIGKEYVVLIEKSTKKLAKNEKMYHFLEKFLLDMFSFKSIFN